MRKIYHFLCSIVYRFRCFFHGIKYKKGVRIKRHIIIERGTKIILSENCWIGHHVHFWGGGKITLGENTHIGEYSAIYSSKEGGVNFGNNVNCAPNLFVIDADHGYVDKNIPICKQPMVIKPVHIGNDCWVGVNCTIIKGVTIGNGCVIGACSFVNKSFNDNLVIGGNPAKILKNR